MTIKELVDAGHIAEDHWLTKASVRSEDIETEFGQVFWKRGIWENGVWEHGIWEYGVWENGIWQNGTWVSGIWKSGIWKSGFKSIGQCKWQVDFSETHVKIGCETRTYHEWDRFFASDEVLLTSRDTEQFKRIHKAYLMAKACREIEGE